MFNLDNLLHNRPKMRQWACLTLICVAIPSMWAFSRSPLVVGLAVSFLFGSAIGIGVLMCRLFQADARKLIKWQGAMWLLILFTDSALVMYLFIQFYVEQGVTR